MTQKGQNMDLKQGERFTNDRGETCQVVAFATDLKDGSKRMVYQKLSGEFEYFIGDGNELKKDNAADFKPSADVETREIFEGEVNPVLMAFLEADTVDEKLEVLASIRDFDDEKLITALEASLDITSSEGTPEDRIYFIRQMLRTRAKFEGNRLRG